MSVWCTIVVYFHRQKYIYLICYSRNGLNWLNLVYKYQNIKEVSSKMENECPIDSTLHYGCVQGFGVRKHVHHSAGGHLLRESNRFGSIRL